MKLSRRAALLSLAVAGATAGPAMVDTWPSRTINFVVPFPAGGNVDLSARIVASRLQEILGQTIIVVNKPGAGGIVAGDFVKRANPDGYTVLVGSNGPLSLGPVFRKTSYDVKKDFAPIGMVSWTPDVIVVRDQVPVKSVAELLAYAKANQMRSGSSGIETAPGIAEAEFKLKTGLKTLGVVYAGSAPFYPALMGGEIDMVFDQISTALPMSKGGAVRILAITDKTRSPLAPEIPTLAEIGMEQQVAGAFIGLMVPSATPNAVTTTLRDAFAKAMQTADIKDRLQQIGATVPDYTPAALEEVIQRDTERARNVAAQMNIKPQ